MSGKQAKRARREARAEGEGYFKEPKRPTTKYRTRQEQQEKRRRERKAAERMQRMTARIAEAVTRKRSDQ